MQLNAKLDQSVAFVIDKELEEMFDNYKLIIGQIMGSLYLDVEEKIWGKFPELRPVEMDGEFKINKDIFEPKFYERKTDI